MLELGQRERHLLGAVWFQVALIGLIVFAYTQAVRQLNYQKERQTRLQEQLVMAREQVSKQATTRQNLESLQEEVSDLRSQTVSVPELPAVAQRVKELAEKKYELSILRVKEGDSPVETLDLPIQDRQLQKIDLYLLDCSGRGTSRQIALFLAHLNHPDFRPLTALISLVCRSPEEKGTAPVEFTAQWVVAVSSETPERKPAPDYDVSLEWFNRLEPFLSPFQDASAAVPDSTGFPLWTGLQLQGDSPTAEINGRWVKPGDRLDAWRILYIGKEGILFQTGEGKERFLPASAMVAPSVPQIS